LLLILFDLLYRREFTSDSHFWYQNVSNPVDQYE
jgi:hypothetical protein